MNEAWLPFLEKHRHPTLRMQCKGPTCVMVFGMQRLGFSVLLLAPPSIIKRPGTNKAPIEINKQQYQPTVEMLKHTHTKKKEALTPIEETIEAEGANRGAPSTTPENQKTAGENRQYNTPKYTRNFPKSGKRNTPV